MVLQTRSTLIERYIKRNREYLVNEVDYQDEANRLLLRGRTHQSFLLDRPESTDGFVVDRDTAGRKRTRSLGEGEGDEIEPLTRTIDRETCWRFSGPGPNYHTDVEHARRFGFPTIVVQGMLSTCLISQALGAAFGEGWFAGGEMSVKLINVLWVDETVRVRGRLQERRPEGSRQRQTLEVWVEKPEAACTPVAVGRASALV